MTFTLLINGRLVAGDLTMPVINPATEDVLAECPRASEAQLNQAVAAAKAAFPGWAATPADKPKAALLAIADRVDAHTDVLARLLTQEVLARARKIDLSRTPSVVRRSRLLLESAHAHATRREFAEAVRTLDAAARTSIEAVALIPWALTLSDELTENAPPTLRPDAKRLASRLKAVH